MRSGDEVRPGFLPEPPMLMTSGLIKVIRMQDYLLMLPFIALGGIVIWIMVFLGTYPHFPRMEKAKRLTHSIASATVMAVVIMVILFISLYLLDNILLR